MHTCVVASALAGSFYIHISWLVGVRCNFDSKGAGTHQCEVQHGDFVIGGIEV